VRSTCPFCLLLLLLFVFSRRRRPDGQSVEQLDVSDRARRYREAKQRKTSCISFLNNFPWLSSCACMYVCVLGFDLLCGRDQAHDRGAEGRRQVTVVHSDYWLHITSHSSLCSVLLACVCSLSLSLAVLFALSLSLSAMLTDCGSASAASAAPAAAVVRCRLRRRPPRPRHRRRCRIHLSLSLSLSLSLFVRSIDAALCGRGFCAQAKVSWQAFYCA
jgi:hypothetical protein